MNTSKYLNKFTRTAPQKSAEEKNAIAKQILAEAMAKKGASNKPTSQANPITNIRKAVATLANKINGKLKNLSAAFKKAWAVIKGKVILSKVSGVTFGNTQKALAQLAKYDSKDVSVELVRESNNEHDVNAVGVTVSVNDSKPYQIGYLPKDLAQYMANLIDKGIKLKAAFKGVTGGTADKYYYGALVEINFPTEKGSI